MTLMAAAFPILPGKTPDWREFIGELNGARHEAFAANRRALGVHERTFLQSGPQGDVVVVTLEGDDPVEAFRRFVKQDDEFSRWFLGRVRDVHGFDMAEMVDFAPMPEQVLDSESVVRMAAAR